MEEGRLDRSTPRTIPPTTMPSNTSTNRAERSNGSLPSAGPINHIHDVLSDPFRRVIIHRLDDREGPVELTELIDVMRETDHPALTRASKQDVRSWLVDGHLLPLERLGLVDYDARTESVRLGDQAVFTVVEPENHQATEELIDTADSS